MTLPPAIAAYQNVKALAQYGRPFTKIPARSLRSLSGYHLTFYESPLRVK